VSIVYIEHQSACPFVVIGSPQPLLPSSVSPPTWILGGESGGATFACGGKGWVGGPNSDEWAKTLALYVYYSFYGGEKRGGRRGHAYIVARG
jgi:hypothetical protein